MCGRFTLRTPTETIADLFAGIPFPDIPPSYNIAPTQMVAAVRSREQEPQFAWLKWGLLPFWARDARIGSRMINARCETIHEKPAFRAAFKKRRCLILADGFYEWKKTDEGKQPVYIHLRDDQPYCYAGLWEFNDKTGPPVETCTIVTTSPNELLETIHDRMPVILPRSQYDVWLNPQFEDLDYLQSLLQPYPADEMEAWPVSAQVNKPSFNRPECIEPVARQQGLDF